MEERKQSDVKIKSLLWNVQNSVLWYRLSLPSERGAGGTGVSKKPKKPPTAKEQSYPSSPKKPSLALFF